MTNTIRMLTAAEINAVAGGQSTNMITVMQTNSGMATAMATGGGNAVAFNKQKNNSIVLNQSSVEIKFGEH